MRNEFNIILQNSSILLDNISLLHLVYIVETALGVCEFSAFCAWQQVDRRDTGDGDDVDNTTTLTTSHCRFAYRTSVGIFFFIFTPNQKKMYENLIYLFSFRLPPKV
jgi:hypothetical protein